MSLKRLELFPTRGMSSAIGLYFGAMEEVREQLRETALGMTVEQIGQPTVAGVHSIGALLLHIGEAEW